jgi:hypothetical protein
VDLVLADPRNFNWPPAIVSFTHVFILVGLIALYNQLVVALLINSSRFENVVSIALLVKQSKDASFMTHSSMLNSRDEQSRKDQIRFV